MSDSIVINARRLGDGTFVQELPDGTYRRIESRTDWKRLAAMSEEEIEANALADEDNPPMTAEELARMQPALSPRAVRRRLHLTQEQVSTLFHLPIGTIRDGEQGKKKPDSAARTLLRVIDRNPEAVIQALEYVEPAIAADWIFGITVVGSALAGAPPAIRPRRQSASDGDSCAG